MKNIENSKDFFQMLFLMIFLSLMTIACFSILRPFILSLTWASMIVIATWPLILKFEIWFGGSRITAIIFMTLMLILLFIMPIIFLIDHLINKSVPLIHWIISEKIQIPKFYWLNDIPIIGGKLYSNYHKMIEHESLDLILKIRPYIGKTTEFFFTQAGYLARFLLHVGLVLLFSIFFYFKGEKISYGIQCFAYRIAGHRSDTAISLAIQTIRSVALVIIATAFIQGILGGIGLKISGIPYTLIFTFLMIVFCILQIGPLCILIPAIIWLYWQGNPILGTFLLIWSCIVAALDNILKPLLIINAKLPTFLIFLGGIGGLLAFGIIGLFIGPAVLSVSYRLISLWVCEVSLPKKNILKNL